MPTEFSKRFYWKLYAAGARIKGHCLRELSFWRTRRAVTRLVGYEYRVSLSHIEIDITYACNLSCHNCNRSSPQAPSRERISLEQIDTFLEQSAAKRRYWKRIRLLGGEPTLHPQFLEIVDRIRRYRLEYSPRTVLEIATNGSGIKVRGILDQLPSDVVIVDTRKTTRVQSGFASFNRAPIDTAEYQGADFRNGCQILSDCGMGLTPRGYYPCAIAGGIDRVLGESNGRNELPADDDGMRDLMEKFCKLCGHFKRRAEAPLTAQTNSETWASLYQQFRQRPTP